MFKKKKTEKPDTDVNVLEKNMAEYVNSNTLLLKVNMEMEEKINRIKEEYAGRIDTLNNQCEAAFAAVQQYAEANRKELFAGKKSISNVYGSIGFRAGREKLVFSNPDNIDKITQMALKNVPGCVRTKVELDKQRLLAEKDEKAVKKFMSQAGITVEKDETFFVKINN